MENNEDVIKRADQLRQMKKMVTFTLSTGIPQRRCRKLNRDERDIGRVPVCVRTGTCAHVLVASRSEPVPWGRRRVGAGAIQE
ncbi:hypothetical protein AAFF_G00091120 [Aldrovandia affinis]|uniref:Uncharacterized protein n=1 Tax=Aldrovandia affinis TaxID=143900 RepID=A0AAD7RW30_9TELE|nr:hypothetical protein AAFF_G00091120 [Aldrovandia affinis]